MHVRVGLLPSSLEVCRRWGHARHQCSLSQLGKALEAQMPVAPVPQLETFRGCQGHSCMHCSVADHAKHPVIEYRQGKHFSTQPTSRTKSFKLVVCSEFRLKVIG